MENYFDFIIFLAFERYYDYEDKRSLTFEELHNYRLALIQEHIDYHSRFKEYDDEYFPELLKEFHNYGLNISLEEERKNFENFLINYDEYFTYDNERIYIKEDVDMESFGDVKFDLPFYENPYNQLICGELIGFSKHLKPMDALHATKIKNEVLKLIEVEKILEKYYYEYKIIKNSPNIETISKFIVNTLTKIGNSSYAKIRCYDTIIRCLGLLNDDDDYDLLSEDIIKDKFCELHEKKLEYLLENSFYDAIFGTKSIACDKLLMDIQGLFEYKKFAKAKNSNDDEELSEEDYGSCLAEPIFPDEFLEEREEIEEKMAAYHDDFEDEVEDDDKEDEDDEEEEISEIEEVIELFKFYLDNQNITRAFYLRYIILAHYLINKYGNNEELENVKSRLLFLLDNYGESLTEEKNFLKVLESVPLDKFTKDDFEDFYMVARVFLIEILKGYAEVDILKKLMYISTYYLLTKDIVIDRIITKYQNTEIGKKVKKVIYNNDYSDFIEKDKKLIKEK